VSKGLTPKQSRFIAEYLVDLNATQAALRAGYSPRTAHATGAENLTKPEVKRAIDDALQRRSERVEIQADDVLRELLTFARTDIRKAFDKNGNLLPVHLLPEDVARAISGIEVEDLFDGHGEERTQIGHVRKVKFWDKVKGLELLGRHLKMFTDKFEVKVDGAFADILKKARERAQQR
jgi:phage terminase small subunit